MRFKRIPIRLASPPWLLSAILLVVAIVFCIRSRSRSDILGFFTPAGHLQAIGSDHDGIVLFFSEIPFGPAAGLSAQFTSVEEWEFREAHLTLYSTAAPPNPELGWRFAGFHFIEDKFQPEPKLYWKYCAMTVPYWFLIVLSSILPIGRVRDSIRRRLRSRHGLCPQCGYDLRHSGPRCPECGHARLADASERPSTGPAGRADGLRRRGVRHGRVVVLIIVLVFAAALYRGSRLESRAFAADERAAARLVPPQDARVAKVIHTYVVSDLLRELEPEAELQSKKSFWRTLSAPMGESDVSLLDHLISLVTGPMKKGPPWGASFCFGNRLVVLQPERA